MAIDIRESKDTIQAYTHSVYGEELTWDIHAAQRAVRAGAIVTTTAIPLNVMKDIAENNSYDPDHLDDVDPAVPGIAAPFYYDGNVGYILIDGHHRNARALRDGVPFRAHMLTEAASRICLMHGEDSKYMPWNSRPVPPTVK